MIPDIWRDILHRHADCLTWRHWASGRNMFGGGPDAPDIRRQKSHVKEFTLAWGTGIMELWAADPDRFQRLPDVFPHAEVRSSSVHALADYVRPDGSRQTADPADRMIVAAVMSLGDVRFLGWLDVPTIQKKGTWQDAYHRWVADRTLLRPLPELQRGAMAWWDAKSKIERMDHAEEQFWRWIENIPPMEDHWARKVREHAKRSKSHDDYRAAALVWASKIHDPLPESRDDYPRPSGQLVFA